MSPQSFKQFQLTGLNSQVAFCFCFIALMLSCEIEYASSELCTQKAGKMHGVMRISITLKLISLTRAIRVIRKLVNMSVIFWNKHSCLMKNTCYFPLSSIHFVRRFRPLPNNEIHRVLYNRRLIIWAIISSGERNLFPPNELLKLGNGKQLLGSKSGKHNR